MIARVLTVAVAIVACAWFVISIRQTHDLNSATSLINRSHSLTGATAAHAASLLRAAGQLNPDKAVELERSSLALHEGDPARARAIALSVSRSEPRNIDAWLAYGSASAHDRTAFAFAYRQAERLAPPIR